MPAERVVQISSVHHSSDTRIFHKICKSLVSAGYQVDLIIQNEGDEIREGVDIIALPATKRKSDRLFKVIPALFRKCTRYPKGTIIHFHDPELIPAGLILKLLGYKVIYDVHEDVPKDILGKDWLPLGVRSITSHLVKGLEFIAGRSLDHIITVTENIKNRFPAERTTLVQNYPKLDVSFRTRETEGESDHIFYLGDITHIRGLRNVIRALEIVNRKEEIRLYLGGKFSPAHFEDELKKEAGYRYVDFVGWIDRADINQYTSASFAGIVTFLPVPNHIEAQPNKLFEYMLYGLPVIASDFELWQTITDGAGMLVDPEDPESIAAGILRLYSDQDLARSMGERGRRNVIEKFNWKAEESKLLSLYDSLTAS